MLLSSSSCVLPYKTSPAHVLQKHLVLASASQNSESKIHQEFGFKSAFLDQPTTKLCVPQRYIFMTVRSWELENYSAAKAEAIAVNVHSSQINEGIYKH